MLWWMRVKAFAKHIHVWLFSHSLLRCKEVNKTAAMYSKSLKILCLHDEFYDSENIQPESILKGKDIISLNWNIHFSFNQNHCFVGQTDKNSDIYLHRTKTYVINLRTWLPWKYEMGLLNLYWWYLLHKGAQDKHFYWKRKDANVNLFKMTDI